jgi:hypothetical protein
VAKDRRISVSDADMRHGRKSKRKRIDGYKRHIAIDVDTPGLICGVAITPANQPERTASKDLLADLNRQMLKVSELFIDPIPRSRRAIVPSNVGKGFRLDFSAATVIDARKATSAKVAKAR